MGGDLGPTEAVAAVALALRAEPDLAEVSLVGQAEQLQPLLAEHGLSGHPRVHLVPASEVITMEDKPLKALKAKKDSSMVRALDLVKSGQAAVAVSSGNTGALMAGGTLRLRLMDGVERPALAAVVPCEKGHFVLIDAGANPEAEPQHLVHNAILGAAYARVILGLERPRIGLLTIGTEEGKGGKFITEAHAQLQQVNGIINYAGLIEGFQVFRGHVDVVVCDGFVGNTLLKTWESLAKFITSMLKTELKKNPLRIGGAIAAKGAFTALKNRMNPDRYGGAPLLGVRGNVLKAHGSSNRHAWCSALLAANKIIRQELYSHAANEINRANTLLQSAATPSSAAAPSATP